MAFSSFPQFFDTIWLCLRNSASRQGRLGSFPNSQFPRRQNGQKKCFLLSDWSIRCSEEVCKRFIIVHLSIFLLSLPMEIWSEHVKELCIFMLFYMIKFIGLALCISYNTWIATLINSPFHEVVVYWANLLFRRLSHRILLQCKPQYQSCNTDS